MKQIRLQGTDKSRGLKEPKKISCEKRGNHVYIKGVCIDCNYSPEGGEKHEEVSPS